MSQSPITPCGLPVASFEAAKFGHDPSGVSLMQELTATCKAAKSAGIKTAWHPMIPDKITTNLILLINHCIYSQLNIENVVIKMLNTLI